MVFVVACMVKSNIDPEGFQYGSKTKLLLSEIQTKFLDLWIHDHDNWIHRWIPLWILVEHRELYRIFTAK